MANRFLVTGGCGFVGVPVVTQLAARGDHVVVLDNLSRGSKRALASVARRVSIVEGDIRDATVVSNTILHNRVDIVVHLAALHFIPQCNADPELCLSTNVLGTQTLLDCASESKTVRGFVYASTAAVYEPSAKPHRETSQLGPTDVYGASKLAAEQLVSWFRERTGTPTAIARLANVYGPNETNPHLIPTIIQQARNGDLLHLGDLSTKRDYVFTADVARALLRLADLTLEHKNTLCNVGTGLARSGEDVVRAVSDAMSRELKVTTDVKRLRSSDRPVLAVDVNLARVVVGWSAKTSFTDGIIEALRSPAQNRAGFPGMEE